MALTMTQRVSLLIIIIEQRRCKSGDGEASFGSLSEDTNIRSTLSISSCAAQILTAVNSFIRAGERQGQASNDQDFISQLENASETLTIASDHLMIKAQRYETGVAQDSLTQALCQAAKDVLQGVLKVLLVIDDQCVKHLLEKTDSVMALVGGVGKVDRWGLVQIFKSITFAVLALKMELRKRCENLCSKTCRDQLMVWTNVLQNSVPSLSKATQTYLKYRGNISAKASRDSVQQEIIDACRKIKYLLQSGPQDEIDDDIVNFVSVVDKVMDSLSEVNRGTLDVNIETDIVSLVQHSMSVAHLAWGVYREMIVTSCHRILQVKIRLLELHSALTDNPAQDQIRFDYENLCETLLDEVCDLEKHVNMTLLKLIIETLLAPLEEVEKLRRIFHHKEKCNLHSENLNTRIQEFTQFTENLWQVALLVASSSTDNKKVREIVTAVKCLESIDPEIAPAALLLSKDPKNRASHKHLDLLLERWKKEVQTIMSAIDTMVDPRIFMDMTETILSQEISAFVEMYGCSHEELHRLFCRLSALAARPGTVAQQLVEENSDPIYRNGLVVFITSLFQKISDAKAVCLEVLQTRHPSTVQFDTLERRMKLVQRAVQALRVGLDAEKHPHLLSEKRMLFKHRSVDFIQEKLKQKREQAEVKAKADKAKRATVRQDEEVHTAKVKIPSQKFKADSLVKLPLPIYRTDIPLPQLSKAVKEDTENRIHLPEFLDEKEFEGGCAAEIYQLVKKLLAASASQNARLAEDLTHSVLGWTNHIVENAALLTHHHCQISKANELKTLMQEVDTLTPGVIQASKFVVAGDKMAVHDLLRNAVDWAKKLNRARVIIDVAVDRWLVRTSNLRQNIEQNRDHSLKAIVNAVLSSQKEMCQILLKTRFLTGKYLENGKNQIEILAESHGEIENLTVTLKTSVEVAGVSTTRTVSDWWQLGMVCRDWSVMMTCVTAELDHISDKMETIGRQKFCGLQNNHGKSDLKMADVLEAETNCILELIDCVVVGDSILKTQSDELVAELQAALSDILSVTRLPISGKDTDDMFCRLKKGLARSRWIEKALDIQNMVHHNCHEYMGFPRQCLLKTQEIAANVDDLDDKVQSGERQRLGSYFLEKSQDLKQKVLKSIQMCPDLARRAVIRSTLDILAKLTTQIEGVMRTSPMLSDADVSCLSDQWAARMKKLLFHLKKMDGVSPSVISEIENLTKAQPSFYQLPRLQPDNFKSPLKHQLELTSQTFQLQQNQQPQQLYQQPQSDLLLKESGHQRADNWSLLPPGTAQNTVVTKSAIPIQERDLYGDTSMSSPRGNPVQVVLKDAGYLDYRLKKWQESGVKSFSGQESKIIQFAIEMAQLCSSIAFFTRGQGPLQSSEEVIGAAVAIVRDAKELESFARRLLSLIHDTKWTDILNDCISRINTYASQLHIITSALHNTKKSFQGDCILMRNTLNLLTAVRQMFTVMESIAAKGVPAASSSDEITREVITVLAKLRIDNEQYLRDERHTQELDELGLRRVERHRPPTLTSVVDLRSKEHSDDDDNDIRRATKDTALTYAISP